MDAFISHSSAQLSIARRIERALEKDGLTVWVDDAEIRAGVLLRDQLAAQIRKARTFVLVWSKAAAKSRWVCAELMTAFHLDRPIIPCSADAADLPEFMSKLLRIDVSGKTRTWPRLLSRAVREAPRHAFEATVMTAQEPALAKAANSLSLDLELVAWGLNFRRLAAARKKHDALGRSLERARRRWRYDARLLNIAGYHAKNAYQLKHWERIQAGQTPADALLQRAERMFFQSLFVNPYDIDALNGLASILILEHELEAARFFNDRALELSKAGELDYDAAEQDREMVDRHLAASAKLRGGRSSGA